MSKANLYLFVLISWVTFPIVALWIWVTNPGKCALIWKREITKTWFKDE